MNVCVITDHDFLYQFFREIIKNKKYRSINFCFFFSFNNVAFLEKYKDEAFQPICLKEKDKDFFSAYDLFFSLHCNQMFPKELVENYTCINMHPGYNPHNRGWFPHVFSMLNGLPAGATIHRMDAELDHGPILYQKTVTIEKFDTSYDVYKKIQKLECSMLEEYLFAIINGNYKECPIIAEGNINYKKDFQQLCEIDMERPATYGEVISYLRAMSFSGIRNAFFWDEEGNKIFVNIELQRENTQGSVRFIAERSE